MSQRERSAAFLLDMIIHIESLLIEFGIEKDKATKVAQNTVDKIRLAYGREQFYFPRGDSLDVVLSHHKIYAKFRGNNHVELAKEFDLSVPYVYRIVKAIQSAEIAEKQSELF
ncbi:hypothetical protein HWQ46_03190 [Shewanella sp. D64]|uniref:Mor transcription activator family protein n=1 Tax=unclassified Shewanella TaxID=196818 RepID=UPI0022BA4278|nr:MULTISPECIES: Mor transcription activator family protein [unclassified Shewanella]MEC4724552.1 hypothetical protein [Shewanella sp. D64]MEC4736671.1 hypothetical protein [Shewanella sp. E94]WBJ94659.1 hypothetical protein HWQ47_22830 [Shewanella sp. MTB7]